MGSEKVTAQRLARSRRWPIESTVTPEEQKLLKGEGIGGLWMLLKVGETAPDFDVPAVTGEEKHRFKLSDLRGKKHVVLAFYVLDWTPV